MLVFYFIKISSWTMGGPKKKNATQCWVGRVVLSLFFL